MNEKARPVAGILACILLFAGCDGNEPAPSQSSGDAALIAEGKGIYETNCAACHGMDLEGTSTGPPFLDPVYAPGHHPDSAFYTAVEFGVQPHHWDFGPMPAQQQITEDQVDAIVAYVRSRQAEAGIEGAGDH